MSAGNRKSGTSITRGAAFPAAVAIFALVLSGCTAGETSVSPDGESTPARAEGPHTTINSTIGIGVGRSSTTIYGLFYEAELRVTPPQGPPGAQKLTLVNTGDGDLGHGPGYVLEKRQGSAWLGVPDFAAHHLMLLNLPSGETANEAIRRFTRDHRVVDLQPGWYRITKDVVPQWDGAWPEGTAAPDFNVTMLFEVTD